MRTLFYATFEKGYLEIIENLIKKQDRTSHIKKVYQDAVLFFADEKFPFSNSLFTDYFVVYDFNKKEGNGAINAEMKHLLERKNLKISLGSDVKKFKLTYIRPNDKVLIDANLRNAFEVMLKKLTKKQIGFNDANAELVLLVRPEGDGFFLRRITRLDEFTNYKTFGAVTPRIAYAMNFLSEPQENEVSLDPFSENGLISYVRSLCFKKANVIAVQENPALVTEIKKQAKMLKNKPFSVMKYDFLSEIFPIRFIDKIVCVLPSDKKKIELLFKKANTLKVKIVVVLSGASETISQAKQYYNTIGEYKIQRSKITVFKFKGK